MRQDLFLDVESIEEALNIYQAKIDYKTLRSLLTGDNEGAVHFVFLPINDIKPHYHDQLIKQLWQDGYLVNTINTSLYDGQATNDIALEMAISILTSVHKKQIDRIILITNRPVFTNLLVHLREWGTSVILVTLSDQPLPSFTEKANRVINLYQYLIESQDDKQLSIHTHFSERDGIDEVHA